MLEVCEDCNEFAVHSWYNEHDESIVEFECRNCDSYWIEYVDTEELVNEFAA